MSQLRQEQQQAPRRTYGRRNHQNHHWQGLQDTELWNKASPVKRSSLIMASSFSPNVVQLSKQSSDSIVVKNQDLKKDSFSFRTPRKSTSSRKLSFVSENKENSVPSSVSMNFQSLLKVSVGKIKGALHSKQDDTHSDIPAQDDRYSNSSRRPLLGKNANTADKFPQLPVKGSVSPVTQDNKRKSLPYVIQGQKPLDFSDLSSCLVALPDDHTSRYICDSSTTPHSETNTEDEWEFDESIVSMGTAIVASPASMSTIQNNFSNASTYPIDSKDTASESLHLVMPPTSQAPTSKKSILTNSFMSTTPESLTVNIDPTFSPASQNISAHLSVAAGTQPPSPLRNVVNANDTEDDSHTYLNDLLKLLESCSIAKIQSFSEYIRQLQSGWILRKLGEASYSEVYSAVDKTKQTSNVLKIMPFGKLNPTSEQASVNDIINELKITKALMSVNGFVQLRGAFIVRGNYPQELLELWDEYDKLKNSENDRPDFYESDQLYCVIILNNAGVDLEHFELLSWKEAASIFWQTTRALAEAEDRFSFEHRDLHWGNIVLERENCNIEVEDMLGKLSLGGRRRLSTKKRSCSDSIKVTIIDYTLSRAVYNDELVITPLDDPSIFSGRGDYQFDIYRFMRKLFCQVDSSSEEQQVNEQVDMNDLKPRRRSLLVSNNEPKYDWADYVPRTNVLWLHYLVERLLLHKKLSAPRLARHSSRRGNPAIDDSINHQIEIEAYQSLNTVYKSIDPRKKRFARYDMPTVSNTREFLEWAEKTKIALYFDN
ncbi:hypothetical protein V1511DRAFT_459348 [Dipodascopsis uninucleata]